MIGDILQPTHLLFILVIALLVLGPKRLPEVGRSLGRGIRDFRHAVSGDDDEPADTLEAEGTSTPAESAPAEATVTPVAPTQATPTRQPQATATRPRPQPAAVEARPEPAPSDYSD